jgi:3-isopropylmalate/(R)-2-methylmalate dehydratase large subunit
MTPQTMFEKLWREHEVTPETADTPAVLYIDLHLTHEVTSPQAFSLLRQHGLRVRRLDRTLATLDHSTPTDYQQIFGGVPIRLESARKQVEQLQANAAEFGVELLGLRSERRGIVHIIGPELGVTQPGTTEVGHVLATQCLLQRKPKTFAINVDGQLRPGVTAKDLVLAIIGRVGVSGGTGHVFEFRGAAIRGLSMDERMTVCNMSIEAGARAGMVAPDDTTFAYLKGRPRAPQGAAWESALEAWRKLPSDPGAKFDREVSLDADRIEPMITYGTNPGMVVPISGSIPGSGDEVFHKALRYMGFEPGQAIAGKPVDVVFIGSCTNARLSDLRAAAGILQGRRVSPGVQLLIVPGSQQVKRLAEAEGLHDIFKSAGADWRESGCSMCLGMNGDTVGAGKYSVSTSNRNFEGRQGVGARTLLASPIAAAAAAVTGRVTDPRELLA